VLEFPRNESHSRDIYEQWILWSDRRLGWQGAATAISVQEYRDVKTQIMVCTLLVTGACAAAWAQGAGPTDPQIAAIVVTANQVDIDAGKLAEARTRSKGVRDFAQLMITDHSGVNKSATELVTRLHVTPESNPTSESLKKGGDDNLANLRGLKGDAFDKAYVDHEVTYHQAVLDALDNGLIPSAQNPELKALLVKVRPAFVAHLSHAKELEATLSQRGSK
jgi:putative membrane protein